MADLYHELYFKSPHFKGLAGHSPRTALDAAVDRLATAESFDHASTDDHISAILTEALGRMPERNKDRLDQWQRAESAVNARIRSLIGMLGPVGTSAVLSSLSPTLRDLPPLESHPVGRPLGPKRADGRIGQPDAWLCAELLSVSIEIKVRGGNSRASYGAEQHLKYLRLAAELRGLKPDNFVTIHALLAPLEHRNIVSRGSQWLQEFPRSGHELKVSPRGFAASLGPRRAAQLEALGGEAWLLQAQSETPTVALDLSELLDRSTEQFAVDGFMARQGLAQIEAVRRYGLPSRPR